MATKLGLEFTPAVYRIAAEERVRSLQSLYEQELYALTLYVAGVAVESMFRAYRTSRDPEFDARHDLFELQRAAGFFILFPVSKALPLMTALSDVAVRWSNNHRFRSDAAMRAFLRRARLNRGIVGDYLKENARRIIAPATELVMVGVKRWKA